MPCGPAARFLVSVREGDGEQWEVGDSGNPYFTVLWREPDLCDLPRGRRPRASSGAHAAEDSEESDWLTFLTRRRGTEPTTGLDHA